MMLKGRVWSTIKESYLRITLNRYTVAFFLFSFIHCFAVGINQAFLYTLDADGSDVISTILGVARANEPTVFAVLLKDGTLQHCNATPIEKHVSPCMNIYVPGDIVPPTTTSCSNSTDTMPMSSQPGAADGMMVQMDGEGGSVTFYQPTVSSCTVTLTKTCTQTLVYPDQVLKNLRREDLSLVGTQFWLLCISVFALLYGSVPHLIAAFCTRILAAAWSSYMTWRTESYIQRLEKLTRDGACMGYDFFSTWHSTRRRYQIPDIVFNVTALVVSAFLTWKLCQMYSKQMFNRVGAPGPLFRLYKFFLALFVCLQLSCVFLVTAMGLWIDQLSNGAISKFSSWTPVYQALFISTSVLLLPWVAMGWYSIRHEKRKTAIAFLIIAFIFIACWAIMFYSQVFRWTFLQWPFFGCITTASFIVLVFSFVLGIVCRFNFNKGLAQFFHVESVLAAADFEPEVFARDPEKNITDSGKTDDGVKRRSLLKKRSSGASGFSVLSSLPVLSKLKNGPPPANQGFVILPGDRGERPHDGPSILYTVKEVNR